MNKLVNNHYEKEKADKKVTVADLERRIFELEEIKVVVRCKKNTMVDAYPYIRKSPANMNISEWYNTRLKPIISQYDADIIDGNGNIPHSRTPIENVRISYVHKDI